MKYLFCNYSVLDDDHKDNLQLKALAEYLNHGDVDWEYEKLELESDAIAFQGSPQCLVFSGHGKPGQFQYLKNGEYKNWIRLESILDTFKTSFQTENAPKLVIFWACSLFAEQIDLVQEISRKFKDSVFIDFTKDVDWHRSFFLISKIVEWSFLCEMHNDEFRAHVHGQHNVITHQEYLRIPVLSKILKGINLDWKHHPSADLLAAYRVFFEDEGIVMLHAGSSIYPAKD